MAEANTGSATSFVPGNTFWIHITNLSSNTTGEDLSKLFDIPVEFILLDTVKNEAWIKNIFRKDMAESKATRYNGTRLNNRAIKCQANVELIHIAKLCSYFRAGDCNNGDRCSARHILCSNPINCSQKNCYYGHLKQRPSSA